MQEVYRLGGGRPQRDDVLARCGVVGVAQRAGVGECSVQNALELSKCIDTER